MARSGRRALAYALVVALLGSLLGAVPATAGAPNMIPNPSFEDLCDDTGTPCGWPSATTSTTAHTGSRSLALGAVGATSACFTTTGGAWDVTWSYHGNGGVTTTPDQLRLWMYTDTTCTTLIALSAWYAVGQGESEWTQHGIPGLLGGVQGSVRVEIQRGTTTGAQPPALIDDFLVRVHDQFGPTGAVSIDGGAQYATTSQVTLSLSASDDWGVTGYRITDGTGGFCFNTYPDVSIPEAVTFAASVPWTLPAGDGARTVCVRYLDERGNTSVVATDTIVVDSTPPVVSITVPSEGAIYEAGEAVIAQFGCSDPGGSGVGDCTGTTAIDSPIDTSPGTHAFTVTATDAAGNVRTRTLHYQVLSPFVFGGFQSPVNGDGVTNVARAGRTIPLRWSVSDGSGNPVTDLTAVTVTSDNYECGATSAGDGIEEYTAGSTGLQNLGGGEYQFNWRTPLAYAGTCRILHLDMGEGIEGDAIFRFVR